MRPAVSVRDENDTKTRKQNGERRCYNRAAKDGDYISDCGGMFRCAVAQDSVSAGPGAQQAAAPAEPVRPGRRYIASVFITLAQCQYR